MAPKKYAIVGTGGRSSFFYTAIVRDFPSTASLVAFCDTNQTRMDYANTKIKALGHEGVPTYKHTDFDKMIQETKPDEVIVTTIDRTHNIYIVRAMELGCDVVSEKPMTIDVPRCQEILDAVERTGQKLRVTFNYRCESLHCFAALRMRVTDHMQMLRTTPRSSSCSHRVPSAPSRRCTSSGCSTPRTAPTTSAAGTGTNVTLAGSWCISPRTTLISSTSGCKAGLRRSWPWAT